MPRGRSGDADPGTEHLGRGWAFPPRWSREGEATLVEGIEDVREAIRIILQTGQTERAMRPEFGADIDRYVFGTASVETAYRLQHDIERALVRWEPRAIIERVTARPLPHEGRIDVVIEYTTDPHRREQSLVYPFYLAGRGEPS